MASTSAVLETFSDADAGVRRHFTDGYRRALERCPRAAPPDFFKDNKDREEPATRFCVVPQARDALNQGQVEWASPTGFFKGLYGTGPRPDLGLLEPELGSWQGSGSGAARPAAQRQLRVGFTQVAAALAAQLDGCTAAQAAAYQGAYLNPICCYGPRCAGGSPRDRSSGHWDRCAPTNLRRRQSGGSQSWCCVARATRP